MQSRQMRRNRKRWERKTGRFLLLASRFSLLLIMTGLLLFHGGRDAEGWGLAGMLLSLTLVCWAAGCLFSGKVALMPTQGPLVFGLVLGMGLLQLSPFIGGLWAPEGIKGFWAALQIAELPSGSPLLALLPGFHSQALLFLLSAAVFQFLLVQLFGGPSGILLLSFAVLCCAALMSLLGLVQHFGGHDWLLWMYKGKTFAVSGPFPNKNHFALLQELGFFTGLGCACGLFSARKGASLWLLAGKWRRPLLAATLACLVLCLLGLFFSYSRAGILCSLVGVIAFSLYAFRRLGDTKSSFMALAVLLVAIGLVSFYGLDVLTFRLEVALSGEDPSGLVRWEIWKTALSAIGLSPFWGTGFGAFRYLSPLFEPSYAPGTISFNVHNDFMELAVVLGIPCALLVLGWLAYLFWRNARGVLAAPRSSLHFVGVGAMAALLVTAGHEVFDYGLQQPGNMLVWLAVTVVLSHAARWGYARKKNDQWELGRPLYVLAILLCIPVFGMLKAYSECYHAGIALNRMNELRELPEVTQAFSAAERQKMILRQGGKILETGFMRLDALDGMADAFRQLAFIRQSVLLAEKLFETHSWKVSPGRVWSAVYAEDLPGAFSSLSGQERHSIAEWYRKAAESYRRMLAVAPTNALVWAKLAQSLDDAAGWDLQRGTAIQLYERACFLYPYNGDVSRLAVEGYWRRYQEERLEGRTDDAAFGLLIAYARRTGEEYPALIGKTLAFIWGIRPEVSLLRQVCPDTVQGQEQLYFFLRSQKQWADALEALKQMERLNQARPDEETPDTLGTLAFLRRDGRDKTVLRRIVAERKAEVYAELGNKEEAYAQQEVARQLLYAERTPEIVRIDGLMERGEYLIAEEHLKKLPDDPRALVRYAEILWNAQRYALLTRKMADFEACAATADEETRERMRKIRLLFEEHCRLHVAS
ncbi:O-antigen ligase family protein [Bilophila wadsworthia]